MKILILLTKEKGGVNLSNQRLAKSLRKKGHLVKIISRNENLKRNTLVKSFFKIRKFIKENEKDYDVIYTQDWSMAFPLIFPYPLSLKKHFCCFCGLQKGFRTIFQKITGRIMSKKLIGVSDSIKDKFPNAKIIYRGIDFKEFRDLGLKRNFVGWTERIHEDFSREMVEKVAKIAGLKPLVINDFPKEKMNNFYNKCKIFISLPKKRAGFNNVWTEAMAAKVPIVIGNDYSVGKSWPIEKIHSKEKIKEIGKVIKNHKHINYRKWLKEKNMNWDSSAEQLIKFFKKRR